MFRYRIRMRKFGPAAYISHLDFIKAVSRALRRADLPVAYSEGYHPLPRLAPGPPLPLGIESEAEYLDMVLTNHLRAEDIYRRLRTSLPPGLEVTEVGEINESVQGKAPALTAAINCLSYAYLLDLPADKSKKDVDKCMEDLWGREELVVIKEKKGKKKTVNIRPLWKGYESLILRDGSLQIVIETDYGPRGTIRPEELATFFPEWLQVIKIKRVGAWIENSAGKQTPMVLPDKGD